MSALVDRRAADCALIAGGAHNLPLHDRNTPS
jgi:hypothetical protein